MKLIRHFRILYILLSFILPLIVIIVALIGLRVTPFGDKTLLISDANGYYINTLSYAGRMFKGLEGITYSFEKGLGGNMMGHLNGILLTPFAFLLSFVQIEDYPTAFTFISVFNFSLCGLTMYLLLSDIHGDGVGNLIFSTTYALIGFNVANVFQAVFFCAAAPLPLMVLGLRKLFTGKCPFLYIFAIAYSLITSPYFGFVLCVTSVLFFFSYLWLNGNKVYKGRLFLRYTISSLCGGLLACVLWLPGFLSLRGGRLNQTSIADISLCENMPFIQIGAKLFTGANSLSQLVDGLPNIFVGALPLILTLLFFISKKADRNKKIALGYLLAFNLISFWIAAFNMLMHAGTITNWFNYRYSYVFSFLLLLVASDTWQGIDEVSFSDLNRCMGIFIISAILIFYQKYEFVKASAVLLDIVLLLIIFFCWRVRIKRPEINPKPTFEIITLIVVCFNLFLNYWICTKNIMDWGITLSKYRNSVEAVDPAIQAIKESDKGFYRMEVNRQRANTTGNDPMLYGYNGVGHGGSNERDFVRTGLNKLGIPWFDMRNYYSDGIPAATDSLLGIKYLVSGEDLSEEKGYVKITNMDDLNIYSNPNVLDIAMLTPVFVDNIQTDFEDVFNNLNRVISTISGEDNEVFAEASDILFTPHNFMDSVTISEIEAREIINDLDNSVSTLLDSIAQVPDTITADYTYGLASKEPPYNQSYIEYSWTAQMDGRYYSYNRSGLMDNSGSPTPVLCYEGYYHTGDVVKGYLPVNETYISEYLLNNVAGRFRAVCANDEALTNACKTVQSRDVTLEKIKDNYLTGTCTATENQSLLFTIPYDEGWTLFLDGEKTDLHMVFDVFMAVDVTSGKHKFEMRYIPTGFNVGKTLSIVALATTILYLILGHSLGLWYKVCRKSEVSRDDSN